MMDLEGKSREKSGAIVKRSHISPGIGALRAQLVAFAARLFEIVSAREATVCRILRFVRAYPYPTNLRFPARGSARQDCMPERLEPRRA
jgi:hypothetical protein